MDLSAVIGRILAGTLVFGAGVACRCPPQAPATPVADSAVLSELIGEYVEDRDRALCEPICDSIDDTVDGWGCELMPLVGPTDVSCTAPDATEAVQIAIPPDIVVPLLQLDSSDCAAVCMTTPGWADAEEIGVSRESIWCTDWAGETLDEISMTCQFGSECVGGRRPLGGFISSAEAQDAGLWWAGMARLEHVSVRAFVELARDLAAHGAPASLVERALAAAEDEVEHTRLCVERARFHGVEPQLDGGHSPAASLVELARQNAREGCVREAFAALEAGWQAQHAASPADRAVLWAIHADEVRHGQLAWDIHAWVSPMVDLSGEIDAAFDALTEAASRPRAGFEVALGLPSPAERVALVSALRAAA